MYSHFNGEHWLKVKKARNAQGLNRLEDTDRIQPNHPLTGRTLRHTVTGRVYKVLAVRQDWWLGRFLVASLESNGSHRQCIVENISSEARDVTRELAVFKDEFEIVH